MTDMDKLVGEQTRLGIQSVDELASYYQSFHTITSHLIAQSHIPTSEQSCAFVRGFQPSLWSKVKQRLEIKFPDFDQDSAYTLEQVYNAATYILHGTHPSLLPQHPITQIKPPEPPASHGKLEDLEVLIGQIAQAMQTLVAVQMQNALANMSAVRKPPQLQSMT
jgi:hypothetical protein